MVRLRTETVHKHRSQLSATENHQKGVHDRDRVNEATSQSNSSTGSQGTGSLTALNAEAEPRVITEQELGFSITAEERERATERRDIIAKEMWVEYQAELFKVTR